MPKFKFFPSLLLLTFFFGILMNVLQIRSQENKRIQKMIQIGFEKTDSTIQWGEGSYCLRKQNGKVGDTIAQINYSAARREGSVLSYYDNGQIRSAVNYTKGQKHGLQKTYYRNGQLASSLDFIAGKKEGVQHIFSEIGNLIAEVPYKNGELNLGTKEYLVLDKFREKHYPQFDVVCERLQKGNSNKHNYFQLAIRGIQHDFLLTEVYLQENQKWEAISSFDGKRYLKGVGPKKIRMAFKSKQGFIHLIERVIHPSD